VGDLTGRELGATHAEALVKLKGRKNAPPILVGGLTCELMQKIRREDAGKWLMTHEMFLRIRVLESPPVVAGQEIMTHL
jgi:hypothetical protein